MTTFSTIEEFLETLRQRPELLEAARNLIISQELRQLPQVVAQLATSLKDLAESTKQNFDLVHERLTRLETDVAQIKTDVAQLKTDVVELKTGQAKLENTVNQIRGNELEREVHANIVNLTRQQLAMRSIQVLMSKVQPLTMALQEAIDDAEEEQRITPNQSQQLRLADVILSGVQTTDRQPVYAAIEISHSIGRSDVDRALERGRILETVTSVKTLATVFGNTVTEPARARAEQEGVRVITSARIPS